MNDHRTDEQRKADTALDVAVKRMAHAYGYTGQGSRVVTDWMVIGAGIGMGEDGDETTIGFHHLPEDGLRMDWHRTLGMLRATTLRLERSYTDDDEDDG